jgi:AAA+ ATPase superfamily predicted ATPase
MVHFSDRPISRIDDLYGEAHKEAVGKVHSAVEEGHFIAILGARRVGKTSIVKTFLNTYNYRFIYFDLSPYMNLRAVGLRSLVPAEIGFNQAQLTSEARLNLSVISLVLRKEKITGEVFQKNLLSLIRELNHKNRKTVVVFDEAQVLPFIKGINYRGILQFIHNNYENIVVVLTGSMPGLLEKLISPAEAEKPGFARYIEEIHIPRWGRNEAVNYLTEGLREKDIDYQNEELHEVYEELSGVPGFISYYGLLRSKGSSHRDALNKTVEYAVAEWERDLQSFLNVYNSPLYIHALAVLAETVTGLKWGELAQELERKLGKPVRKSTLHRILTNLLKAGMIEKQGEKYYATDRSLRRTSIHIAKKQESNSNTI